MSRSYKFSNSNGLYFVSFAVVYWIDVFSRKRYCDILVESINYCIENKGLTVNAWVIMTNHVHLLIHSETNDCAAIIRDLKKFTSKAILKEIETNMQESRREWMLWMFKRAGEKNSNNKNYQFWQQHNQPIDLSNNIQRLDKAINYIHQNPVSAGFVCKAEDYLYSSAIDYIGEKGFIKIEKIW